MSDRDDGYGPSTYGDRIADVYDEIYPEVPSSGDVSTTVDFLSSLAGSEPALELGIGTGRVAIPLAAAGVKVHGIDASSAMVDRMRAKPGGDAIPVTIGDFRDFSLEMAFSVIYVPFNTFFGLLTQDDQVACFRAVARHLAPGGVFVMEAFVPDVARFDRGQRVSAIRVEPDEVSLDVSIYDPTVQVNDTQHVVIREDGIRLYPVRIRFAFVPELDLMARLAGLRLRERWADWERTPFSSGSEKHISVWERAPDAGASVTPKS
ncbi:MAG: class I SAM-dependent DNA methyltransferase [Actinomycetota bacterium]